VGDKRELRCFGQLIRIDRNRKPRQVRETRFKETQGRGKRKSNDRMGRAYVEDNEEKKGKTFQEVTRLVKVRKTSCSCSPMPERATRD
jgi:hypothetical protein